jgi:putative heme-binding domain-containing protein
VKELPALLDDASLRIDAIRAVAGYDDENLGNLLIKKYPGLNVAEKREAVLTLSSRPRYGRMLTKAIKEKTIPKADVPVYVARQLRRVVGSGFVETWGPIDELPASENAAYNKYQRLLTNEALAQASPQKGKMLFQRTCGSCHTMFGEGGIIGPDLTGSNRTNISYILSNVLNPSEEIQDDYKMVVVTTRDGRTYSGNIVGENARQITMRVVGQDAVMINKSEIQSKEVTDVSMMPPGLFDMLRDEEVLDLVSYLRSADQSSVASTQ